MHILPPFLRRSAASLPARRRPAPIDIPLPDDGGDLTACGWFESSLELQQGLAVSELPDSDGTVAALWFPALVPDSARLQ